MSTGGKGFQEALKLQEICRRLGVDYDDARYTLAQDVLPADVPSGPGRGNHRLFGPRQAFMLAIVLKLRAVGLSTSIAKKIAQWSPKVQTMAVNSGWDWQFAPLAGEMHSDQEWYLDIGDARYVRIVTNASPTGDGTEITPWVDMATRRKCPAACPAIIFRIDFVEIARLLAGTANESNG